MEPNTVELLRLLAQPQSSADALVLAVSRLPDVDAVLPEECLTLLGKAVELGHAEAVKVLLDAGARVEYPESAPLPDFCDSTTFVDALGQAVQAFMYEMSNGPEGEKTQARFDVVVHLLEAGADPEAIDRLSFHSPLAELVTQLNDYAGCGPSVEDMEPAFRLLAKLVRGGVDMDEPGDAAAVEQPPFHRLNAMAEVGPLWEAYARQARLEETLPVASTPSVKKRM